MLKTAPSSRIHLIAADRSGGKAADPAIRRFRLARLRVEGRSPDLLRPGHTQRA
ncbi:MAG TPA: hypothetical protein VFN55_07120 [Solirubrobacteraceae bacterium]|nr:hypothetical protein [Solirubrobacteraceae bacterium]